VPERPRGWWSEHGLDVLVALLTIVGLYIGYKIPIALNEQDSQERLKSERTGRFEADVGLVNQLVSGPLGEEGAENIRAKRAAARAISEYAQQGRVYTPHATAIMESRRPPARLVLGPCCSFPDGHGSSPRRLHPSDVAH